jgi:hypothetical protein
MQGWDTQKNYFSMYKQLRNNHFYFSRQKSVEVRKKGN